MLKPNSLRTIIYEFLGNNIDSDNMSAWAFKYDQHLLSVIFVTVSLFFYSFNLKKDQALVIVYVTFRKGNDIPVSLVSFLCRLGPGVDAVKKKAFLTFQQINLFRISSVSRDVASDARGTPINPCVQNIS